MAFTPQRSALFGKGSTGRNPRMDNNKLAAIRARREMWDVHRCHSGGIVGARDDIAALLDHVAELTRVLARQRRAIYRLAALVFEWHANYNVHNRPRCSDLVESADRIRARLATLEAPHE
jgi:hypothetical protein